MGPAMGTLGGLAAWFSLSFKSAFALLGIGILTTVFDTGLDIFQIKLIAVGCVLFFMVVNIFGVKMAGRLQSYLVIVLLGLLVFYVLVGSFFIDNTRFNPTLDQETVTLGTVFATAGLVFVSFAGTTKITELAGEVKNPGRNLPLGMFLSWGVVTLLYILVIFVTMGVLDPNQLQASPDMTGNLSPITTGGGEIMGTFGLIVMGLAALLAYVSTANAGILAASRDPMAMGKDDLLPRAFAKVSEHGTPWVAILFTSGFMICVVLFLDLEDFVKTASTLKLILFILANLSLIFMREANIRHYRPKYRAPLYPYIQIFGIGAYIFLILQMGNIPLITAGVFLVFGLAWYFFYAYGKIKREYALLHVVERVMGEKTCDHLIEEELREIMIERDDLTEARFEDKLSNSVVLDLDYFVPPEDFAHKVATPLSKRLNVEEDEVFSWLIHREKDSNIIVREGCALISFHIRGRNKFEIAMVRTKRGAMFSEEFAPVNAAFILVSSADQENFYLHSLMWLVQLEEIIDFKSDWMEAKSKEEIRQLVLDSWNLIASGEIDAKSIEIEEPESEIKKDKKEKSEGDGEKKTK
jgi:amino acid transporter/mannitol/fructose-specific phosphotransferase system IIA component (Ntr-type)